MSPSPWKTPWEFPQRVTCVAHGHFMYHSFNINTLSFYRKHLLYGTDPYYVDKIPWGDYWYYTSLAVPSWECERLPPTNFNIFTVKNVIWWTYIIWLVSQYSVVFFFVLFVQSLFHSAEFFKFELQSMFVVLSSISPL